MSYYIYENWHADDKTKIHLGSCGSRNDGRGTGKGTKKEQNGRWWGPYEKIEDAKSKVESLKRQRNSICQKCIK